MSRAPDYAIRESVVQVLKGANCALSFRLIQSMTGGSDWNLRMALNYLIEAGIVSKRGRKGVPCKYSLTGREFESGKRREFDASALARVW